MNVVREVTVTRKLRETQFHLNGQRVGEAYKLTGTSGFGLRLRGIYWRKGEPNNRGGSSASAYPRLQDAVAAARAVLADADLSSHLTKP